MSCSDPGGSLLDGHGAGEGLGNGDDLWDYWDQLEAGALQFGTPPNHAVLNPESMNVQPPQLAQGMPHFETLSHPNTFIPSISTQMNSFPSTEPGTSQSSNITNADAAAKTRESKRKSWEKKETLRKENEKRLDAVTGENIYLKQAMAMLEKEGAEAKIKQKSADQEISCFKGQFSRLNNKLKGHTMQVDVLSEKLVDCLEATDVAEENKQLKLKIELLTTATNNPGIIKTVELQEENEKLKRENKKLRILNDALCDKMNKDEQRKEVEHTCMTRVFSSQFNIVCLWIGVKMIRRCSGCFYLSGFFSCKFC